VGRRPGPLGLVPKPVGPKVPAIIAIFWVVKILTTAGGEAGSDFLSRYGNLVGGGTVVVVLAAGVLLQFMTRRYRAASYWFLAYAIAIFGTAVADFLHLDVHLSYLATSAMWAVILAAVFTIWHRTEGTLSIHSIVTTRREIFYWLTVLSTFALGTALGDLTAATFGIGFWWSIVLFGVLIVLPALAWRFFGLNSVTAFWSSYVVTRPLGASIADWLDKPRSATGLGLGSGPVLAFFTLAVAVLVAYLTIARPDIQDEPEIV
jgi:uncharacterized membrane-anchored protein